MVYTGKPSKACALCRQRKIKCDQLRPACSQCVRLRVECPGYRHELDLLFRDQTADLVRRVEQPRSRASTAPATSNDTPPRGLLGTKPAPIRVLGSSVEDLASPFFLQYFFADNVDRGRNLVPSLVRTPQTTNEDDPMSAAMAAVGWALVANVHGSYEDLIVARQKYGRAVRLTSQAVQRPASLDVFQILLTVLLLSYYEVVTCSEPESLYARDHHLTGAIALLKAQGAKLVKDRGGLALFMQIRSQIVGCSRALSLIWSHIQKVFNCLQRNQPVPPVIVEVCREARALMQDDEILHSQLSDFITELCELRHGIVSPETLNDPNRVAGLIALDRNMEQWEASLPESWRYEVRRRSPNNGATSHAYHCYPSNAIAAAWQDYRSTRLVVNDTLLTHVDYSISVGATDERLQTLREKIVKNTMNLCWEICASLPQFLGRFNDESDLKVHAGGMQVIWSLFFFGCMRCISQDQRTWAMRQLERVGADMGVCQATQLSKVMAEKKRHFDEGTPDSTWFPPWKNALYTMHWYEDIRMKLPRGG